jgi:uncharacterized protein YycO
MRGRSWISEVIRWQTRCWASHAALYVGDGKVLEAWTSGVREHTMSAWDNVVAYTNPFMKPEDWKNVEALIRGQLGKPYDFKAVLRFLAWQRDSDSDNGKWFCFELVAWALQEAGFQIGRRKPSRTTRCSRGFP